MATPLAAAGPQEPIYKLVLAPVRFHPGLDMTDGSARVVSDSQSFRRLLARSRPTLVVIFAPPATPADVAAVVRVRRRRREMRAVLIDEPGSINERLAALRAGFDEAIGTDIDGRELVGRLSLLAEHARGSRTLPPIAISADLELDPNTRELRICGERVHLRPREFGLLEVLARNPDQTFSRRQLLRAVGVESSVRELRTVDVHIRWLREKLRCGGSRAQQLITVRGVGYRLEPARPKPAAALTKR